MNLGPLLTAAGLAAVTVEARLTARRLRRRLAAAVATSLLVVTAAGFALAALTDWLAHEFGTTTALASVATGLVLLSFSIHRLSLLLNKRRAKPRPEMAPLADLAETLEARGLGSEMIAVGVIALAGFLLARQIRRT